MIIVAGHITFDPEQRDSYFNKQRAAMLSASVAE